MLCVFETGKVQFRLAQPCHEVVENAEMRPVKNESPTQLIGFIYEQFLFLLVIDFTMHQGTVQMVPDTYIKSGAT